MKPNFAIGAALLALSGSPAFAATVGQVDQTKAQIGNEFTALKVFEQDLSNAKTLWAEKIYEWDIAREKMAIKNAFEMLQRDVKTDKNAIAIEKKQLSVFETDLSKAKIPFQMRLYNTLISNVKTEIANNKAAIKAVFSGRHHH
jgi:hypothetical protein